MIKDYFLFVARNFARRKLRGMLTMLGILIGIAAVVALISVSQGLENAIKQQFQALGTDKIIISPGSAMGVMGAGFATTAKLTEDDLDTIRKVSGVDMAAGMVYASARVKFKDEMKYTFAIGLPLDDESKKLFEEFASFKAEEGDLIEEDSKNEVDIGWIISYEGLFKENVSLKDKILIEDQEFKVIGIIKKIGNRQDDTQVYLPLEVARDLFNRPDEFDMIVVKAKPGYDMDKIVNEIKKDLRRSRNEEEGEETFQIQTFEQLLEQVGVVLNIVRVVLIAIAAISLLVGGIGIMNTMYTGVVERTREIGIMKAIGAKNSNILMIFLIESGMYGLVGGAAGICLGFGLSKATEIIATQALGTLLIKASFSWWLILGALAFSFIIGCISGVAPARQASQLRPVDALRYE